MKPVSTFIVDDEPGNIVTLSELIKHYCPQLIITGTAENPAEALDRIKTVNPQLVFLDIEMPYGNAFDLLDKLSPVNFQVVFVTAFNDYAIKAFKYAAVDYLLKPVNITELKTAVQKVISQIEKDSVNTKINHFLESMKISVPSGTNKIALPTGDGSYFEDINNIMYLEASGNYTHIFCKGKGKIVVTKKIKEYEDSLPENIFFRVHNSSIININYVKKYFNGRGGYVVMEDGMNIQIAARKKAEFLSLFK
ncbi:MAG: response regulator transcription factor [Sphingobacteriales bacterium]|nr:MAG: response regulator transcription factor [Sphingobacteriales bacterium]